MPTSAAVVLVCGETDLRLFPSFRDVISEAGLSEFPTSCQQIIYIITVTLRDVTPSLHATRKKSVRRPSLFFTTKTTATIHNSVPSIPPRETHLFNLPEKHPRATTVVLNISTLSGGVVAPSKTDWIVISSMTEPVTTVQEPSKSLTDVASLRSEADMKDNDEEEQQQEGQEEERSGSPGQQPDSGDDQSIRPARGVGKRPLLTHKDGKMLSEKKLRRLEKNRLSARECRRRKREATDNLQREINVLEGENLRLRLQLQIGDEAEENMKREQAKLTEDIDALLKSGAPESEILSALESFKEKHADYGRDRRSAIEFHLRNIERLLMPTQTTSIVMKAIQGGQPAEDGSQNSNHANNENAVESSGKTAAEAPAAAAVTPPAAAVPAAAASSNNVDSSNPDFEPKSLFQYLVKYLGVTPEQAAALKDSRFVAMEMDDCLAQALKVLAELRERMTQTGEDLETEFDNVRAILTPTQAAKFLVWVANNDAALHMLNELWERVYPAGSPDNAKNED